MFWLVIFLWGVGFENIFYGAFESLDKHAVDAGGLVFGAFDVAHFRAGVEVGDGQGADETSAEIDIVLGHDLVEEGHVIAQADHFFDGLQFIGAQIDIGHQPIERIGEAAVILMNLRGRRCKAGA